MEPFFGQYRSVMPYLMADDDPPPLEERHQSPKDRGALRRHHQVHPVRRLHQLVPFVLGPADVRRPGRHRQRPPLHLRLRATRAPHERLEILADEDGVWRCRTIFNCTDACPRGINITRAILEVSGAIVERQA